LSNAQVSELFFISYELKRVTCGTKKCDKACIFLCIYIRLNAHKSHRVQCKQNRKYFINKYAWKPPIDICTSSEEKQHTFIDVQRRFELIKRLTWYRCAGRLKGKYCLILQKVFEVILAKVLHIFASMHISSLGRFVDPIIITLIFILMPIPVEGLHTHCTKNY